MRIFVPILAVTLILPALFLSADVSAADDLSISSVVVVQVLPEPRGVVANKSAALCVTVVSSFSEEVLADIRVTYNHGNSTFTETGPDGAGVPLAPGVNIVYVPGGNCTAHMLNWTSDPATLVWNSTGTDSNVAAEVDPADLISETDETNNALTMSPIDVWASRSLRILVVPMCSTDYRARYGTRLWSFSLDEELRDLLGVYPLADDGVEIVEAPTKYERFDMTSHTDCGRVALNLSAEARALGYDHVVAVFEIIRDYWGIETYGCAVGAGEEPRDPVPLFITASGIVAREALLAHELGHVYYLWHPHDIGIRVYNATKYSAAERQYGLAANTFMTYPHPSRLPEGVPISPRWVDVERYQNHTRSWIDLRDRFTSGPEGTWEWNLFSQLVYAPRTLGPIVVIDGSILRSGAVDLGRWYAVPLGIPEEQNFAQQGPVGMHAVRMLDSARNVLGNTYFNVSFTQLIHSDGVEETWDLVDQDSVRFVVNAPNLPGTRYVQIVDPDDAVLAERAVSSSVPTVQVESPNGGEAIEIGQSHNISWTGSDLDGDGLSYFVSYTPDGGETWILIASNITADSLVWNTTGVAPTDSCKIMVMASDGFNTGQDESDAAFEMSDSVPPTTTVELEGELGEDGWFVSGVNVSLFAGDNSRVSTTEYRLDDATWAEYEGSFRLEDEGVRTLMFRSEDLAGNVESAETTTIKIDLSAPQVSISSPLVGSTVGDDAIFRWSASDTASGVAGYEVRVNGGSWIDVGTSEEWECVGLVEGNNTFEVRATDIAGNFASASVDFVYEKSSRTTFWIMVLVIGSVVAVGAVAGAYYWRKHPPKAS